MYVGTLARGGMWPIVADHGQAAVVNNGTEGQYGAHGRQGNAVGALGAVHVMVYQLTHPDAEQKRSIR